MHKRPEKDMPVKMVRLSRVTLSMHISVCFDRNSGLADAGISLQFVTSGAAGEAKARGNVGAKPLWRSSLRADL
jgi:hypothetical protein